MRLISVRVLGEFWNNYPDAEQPLKSWVDEIRNADWETPSDIKDHFRSASVLKNRRVVFNIKGNSYRLVAAIAYRFGVVYIKFIGTHKQYDAIDVNTIEME